MKKEALLLETNPKIVDSLSSALKESSYTLLHTTSKEDGLTVLKERNCPLALVGHYDQEPTPFGAMKDIVVNSPITSIILITDLPEEEIQEETEGYGILGCISRHNPGQDVPRLLDNFEQIFKSLEAQ